MCKKIVSCRLVKSENEDDRMNVDLNTVNFDTLDLIDCHEDVLVSSSSPVLITLCLKDILQLLLVTQKMIS